LLKITKCAIESRQRNLVSKSLSRWSLYKSCGG